MRVTIKNFRFISGVTMEEVKRYFERIVYLMDQSNMKYYKDISSSMNVEFEIKLIENDFIVDLGFGAEYEVNIIKRVIEWVIK